MKCFPLLLFLLSVCISLNCRKSGTQQQLSDCQKYNSTILRVVFVNAYFPHHITAQEFDNSYKLFGPLYRKNLPVGTLEDTVTLYSKNSSNYSTWSVKLASDTSGVEYDTNVDTLTLKQCGQYPVLVPF